MTIRWRNKVILAEIEDVYGTDPVPVAANAILLTDVALSPMEGEDINRNLDQGFLGNQETLPSSLYAKLTGSTELAGSGAVGTAPAWGPLIKAAGFTETVTADTKVEYSRNSNAATQASLTFYIWIGGTLYKSTGARLDGSLDVQAGQVPKIKWTLQGRFAQPTDTAQVVPDFSTWIRPLVANNTNTPVFTLDGVSLVMRSLSLNLGTQLANKFLIGRDGVDITDFKESCDVRVEAVPLATFNPYLKAAGGAASAVALALHHGTVAGNIIALSLPRCQVKRPAGPANESGTVEWTIGLMPLPNAGDDQIKFTLT